MARFVKGDVVVVPFPFSDLTQSKRRPALVVAVLDGDDRVLCQITSQNVRDRYAIAIDSTDFVDGSLHRPSNVRPSRVFTADESIIVRRIGRLGDPKLQEIIDQIVDIVRN